MRLFVGQTAAGGDIRRFASRFNLLELRAEPGMPKAASLRRWLSEVPQGFAFSVVLPESVSALDGSTIDEAALERAIVAADTLRAHFIVLRTPPSARPTSRTRRRLEELVARLPRGDRRIAWEPRGLWEDEDAEQMASTLDLVLVRDVSRSDAPPGDVVYARLRALGAGGRITSGAIERAIDELEGRTAAYVIIEGSAAPRAARMLREALGGASDEDEGGGDEDEDEEDELGADDDEDFDADADDDEDE
jgi:uncharacterized protein YecE (DUF72 family)